MTESNKRLKVVVVTGASSGIGRASAEELARRGFHVLAGVRNEEDAASMRSRGVEPVLLDVTKSDHIAALAKKLTDDREHSSLYALVNNAGIGANAPVEVFDLKRWRKLFDVNYFGLVEITQQLLPLLVESRGRVVNISSVGGRIAMAAYGPYAGAKFALEALSDSLRREMQPLGVDVVVIEPGAVRTKISDRAIAVAKEVIGAMNPAQKLRYERLMRAVIAQAASANQKGKSAVDAARIVADAVTVRNPRTRYSIGREAKLINLLRLIPDRAVDLMLASVLRPYYAK